MPNTITNILTDIDARTTEKVESLLISSADVASPWTDVAAD
jgi:hypothetical protein